MDSSSSVHPAHEDDTHVWGSYREHLVDQRLLIRAVRIYDGGRTSVHRHAPLEMMMVESGSILVEAGPVPGSLESHLVAPGQVIRIPPLLWHRVSFAASELSEGGTGFAQFYELMVGDNANGQYDIERTSPAIPRKQESAG